MSKRKDIDSYFYRKPCGETNTEWTGHKINRALLDASAVFHRHVGNFRVDQPAVCRYCGHRPGEKFFRCGHVLLSQAIKQIQPQPPRSPASRTQRVILTIERLARRYKYMYMNLYRKKLISSACRLRCHLTNRSGSRNRWAYQKSLKKRISVASCDFYFHTSWTRERKTKQREFLCLDILKLLETENL